MSIHGIWAKRLLFFSSLLLFNQCSNPPFNRSLILSRVRTAQVMGRPDWARYYLAALLAHDPSESRLWLELGDANLAGFEGSVSSAVSAYQKCLETQPIDENPVRIALANAYLLQGTPELALRIMAPVPESLDVHLIRARCLLPNHPEMAFDVVQKTIKLIPISANAYLQAAEIARVQQDWQAVLCYAQKAWQDLPLNPSPVYLLALVSGKMGKSAEQAEFQEIFSKLRQFQSIPAKTLLDAENKLILLSRLERTWPGRHSLFLAHQVFLQTKTGDILGIEKTFGRLVEDLSLEAEEEADLVQCLLAVGQYSKAETVLKDLAQKKNFTEQKFSLLWVQWAMATRRYAEVEAKMSEQIQANAPIAPYYYWRAAAFLWQNRDHEAELDFREAVNRAPWFGDYRIELAKILISKGEREEARELLTDSIVERDPKIADFLATQQL